VTRRKEDKGTKRVKERVKDEFTKEAIRFQFQRGISFCTIISRRPSITAAFCLLLLCMYFIRQILTQQSVDHANSQSSVV
jgi:hypothetical protein